MIIINSDMNKINIKDNLFFIKLENKEIIKYEINIF